MLYTQKNVRDNIRNRDGKRIFYLGEGDTLTPGAKDFLAQERIEIRPAGEAPIKEYRLLGGGFVKEKPEHMTHLYGDVLVHKTHPRIVFRGAVDTLEAELLLCQKKLPGPMAQQVQQILDLTRRLIRCDVLEESVPDAPLCGLTQQEIRNRSHRPQDFYGQVHFMPESEDTEEVLLLNRCRCFARNAELAGVQAFSDREGNPTREDILRALNRISSMLYLLMIQCKVQAKETEEEAWIIGKCKR